MKLNRRKTSTTRLGKISGFFFDLAWKGGVVGFFLVLILYLVGLFFPETKDAKISILCFVILVFYFMSNLSMFYAVQFFIDLIDVRRKEVTKRMGLEQALVDVVVFLFCWWVIYWIAREMVFT